MPSAGDWLVFTPDDQILSSAYNPQGALSHNLADFTGTGGSGFNNAPSLTGALSLGFAPAGAGSWNVSVESLAYTGQATPVMYMNQLLVTPQHAAAQNPVYGVDGVGNSGTWNASSASNWSIQYGLDFYFATNADGDPAASDVDATFNDTTQQGYLLSVSLLTADGLAGLSLDDPAGFYAGDFRTYLLDQVAPRLPADATYVLVTQMAKVHPDYAEAGLPITTAGLVGNTTIAYTTSLIPEPAAAALLGLFGPGLLLRRRRIEQ